MIIPIDECDSCRELDAEVARVLGWKRIDDLTDQEVATYVKAMWRSDREPTRDDIHHQRMRWIVGGECDHASWMRPDGLPVEGCPQFSENIRYALDVLNHFIQHDDGTTFVDISALFPGSGDAAHWEVRLNGNEEWVGTGNTQALAICIAFLKANGVDGIGR